MMLASDIGRLFEGMTSDVGRAIVLYIATGVLLGNVVAAFVIYIAKEILNACDRVTPEKPSESEEAEGPAEDAR